MSTDPNAINAVGLQIGGTVGPNDRVGMHVAMPQAPGVGVRVDPNMIVLDQIVKEIADNTPANHANAAQIQKVIQEIRAEQNSDSKINKMKSLVALGANVATIATAISKLAQLLG